MEIAKLRKKINQIVEGIDDENFLLHLCEFLEAKVRDENEMDIVHELSPVQYKRLKESLQDINEGRRISHVDAMKQLKSVKGKRVNSK